METFIGINIIKEIQSKMLLGKRLGLLDFHLVHDADVPFMDQH